MMARDSTDDEKRRDTAAAADTKDDKSARDKEWNAGGDDRDSESDGEQDQGRMSSGRAAGWREIRDDDKAPATAKKETRVSDEDIRIEMDESPGRTKTMDEAAPHRAEGSVSSRTADEGSVVTFKVYKRRWFGLVQLALLNIIVSWDGFTFAPVANNAALYFNTDVTAINWLSTAFFFAFIAVSPVVIYVLHLGPKPSIATAAALILIGNWVRYAGAHSSSGGIFGVAMFGQILTGLAQPFILSAPARYSDLWFTDRGRVAATALGSLANPFGAALGQLITPFWVSQPGDVSSMVLYVSIIATVCALPAFFIPAQPPTPVAASSETPKLQLFASAKVMFSQLEFYLLLVPFAIYVGLFNSIASLLSQILVPHGYNDEEAGIAGAILIVVGLVTAAATAPIIDRTKSYLLTVRVAVPLVGLCYLAFIWMPETRPSGGVAGPYIVMALLGASSFSLMPVVIEYMVELTHPISPEVTSTVAWCGGQLCGGIFLIISDALRDGEDASPPFAMKRALVFSAVMALVAVPMPLCLGLFGRQEKLRLRRVESDERERNARVQA